MAFWRSRKRKDPPDKTSRGAFATLAPAAFHNVPIRACMHRGRNRTCGGKMPTNV